jgi:regulator of sirC expression with transglutaminase-like and TPR domain
MSRPDPAPLARAFVLLVGQEVEDERIDLARAALTIAQTEYPDLDVDAYCGRIESLGQRVKQQVPFLGDPSHSIAALNQVLFEEEGFRGNAEDYYDPRNSFLNEVLDRKLGIPITLAVVYMEVARRVGFPLVGVGMPGHFLLKHYDIEGREILVDPFSRGGVLTATDCQHRLDQIYGGQMPLQPEFLMAVSRRQVLVRMLNNLRSIYLSSRNFRKALPVVDLILAVYPRSPEDVKQRAMLRWSLGQSRGALADLEDYLKMSPDASDADEIRQTAASLRRMMATMN